MPRQQQTNVEFLTELMEYSKFGPMVQGFVIHCLHMTAKEIAEHPDPEKFGSALFDGQLWQDIAKDVLRQMDERYGANDRNPPTSG
ncbi:hypothetical protein DR66_3856 [Delftia acidovorans]|uniref:hypothetical protein n=1 Tax=Delftia acidovorans TaxID=80866 RepID=UPI000503C379|nr:hypothetical protein [Delftia acidovorans]KFJ12665.1 hypothetical protein DR66_3856 [Delftia acidovorans]QQB53206.1 hypothetical protein I6H54_13560 [Delftia acidovorans]